MADLPTGTGTFAGAVTVIAAGLLWLRSYLSGSAVTQVANAAQVELVNMLREQLVQERARADAAESARNEAVTQIGELRNQVAQLSLQVQGLKTQLAGVASNVANSVVQPT
jgi:chromosome segregation ATPase